MRTMMGIREIGRRRWGGWTCGLLLVLALAAAPGIASAAAVSVPANTVLNGVGASGQVAVSIDDATGLEGADLRFTFDPAIVSITAEVTTTALSSGCMPLSNTAIAGVLQVGLACQAALNGGGVLFNIPVHAQGAGATAFTISSCTLNEGAIACTPTSGTVTVAPPTPTRTRTATRTPTATATRTLTRTATPLPTVVLNPLSVPILVGGTLTLTGQGFTAGSVIVLFVSAGGGVQQYGPFTPSSRTASTLVWNVPANILLGNGFASVQVVNTDQNFIGSNLQSALLQGAAAAGLPSITALNGVALNPPDPSVPLANVSAAVPQNSTLTVTGTGFSNPVVVVYSSNPTAAALEPLAGGSGTQIQVPVPADIPTGPGSFQVLNRPSFKGSNLVSAPIGERIRLDSVSQLGSTITVTGAGFSVRTIISFFNMQSGQVVNVGGVVNGTQSLIPFTLVSSHQLTFQVPGGAHPGASYVQLLNPPFIAFTATGNSPNGALNLLPVP